MSDTNTTDSVSTQNPTKPNNSTVGAQSSSDSSSQASSSTFDWTKLAVGGLSALAGILGTPYGIYVAGGLAVGVGVLFFVLRAMWKNYQFESSKTEAGGKTGTEASNDQQKVDDNRGTVDDFIGRDHRS